MPVTHQFVSTKPDEGDATLVRPSNWNAAHDVSIGTAEIADDAVTYAKIQNVSATDKVLGRSTAGAGDVEEIACTDAARAFLDDLDAQAQRNTLVLGAADMPTFGNLRSDTALNVVSVGPGALPATSTGIDNTAVGDSSLASNTSGASNVAVGSFALNKNTTASFNMAVGGSALQFNTTGASNVAVGASALLSNTTGGNNVAIGTSALQASLVGINNVAIGTTALSSNTSNGNIGIGTSALAANTSGSNNTAIGNSVASGITTGINNTCIGGSAGSNITTGASNIVIGRSVSAPSATATGQITIGNLFFGTTATGTGTTVSTGNAGIGEPAPVARLHVKGSAAGTIVGIDQGAASQTASLREWQNSSGTMLAKVDKDGFLTLPGGLRLLGLTTSAGAASTTEYPNNKDCGIHINTTLNTVALAFNNAGTIVTAALA